MKYDWTDYEPFSKPLGEMYHDALRELETPFPSIKLPESPMFNRLTNGFRMREFTILCGSTGTGKTTLLSNWAYKLLKAHQKVFVMSIETGATDFVKRIMSAFLGSDINRGDAVPKETLEHFHKSFGDYFTHDDMFLSLYDNRIDLETVKNEILYHHEVKGCKFVFIDNLNFLMEMVAEKNLTMEMDRVIHDLIMLVKHTDIHVVMVMHPKKTEGEGRVLSEFDIKGSSTAVQEAYNVLLFNRLRSSLYDEYSQPNFHRELTFQKLRRMGENNRKTLILNSNGTQYQEVTVI